MIAIAERIIDCWRDGDPRCHCTHCEVCGLLFRTEDIAAHLRQGHLGGKKENEAHRQAGCDMLVALDAGIRPAKLDSWIETELQLRDVREWIAAGGRSKE